MAPEVFGGNYSTKADLWSAGVVAYEIISGKKPFAAMNQMGVVANIASGKYSLTGRLWMEKTKAAKDFIGSLIQRDADKRIDAIGALQHKWIGKVPKGKLKDTRSSHGIGAQIMSYGEAPTIKKLGLLMIAHKTFPEEVVKLQRHFSRFDPKNTGVITLENFEAALHELNKEYSHEDIQHIFNSMDTYNLGEVAYTEFIAAMLEKYVHLTEDRIADAFDRLDSTSSGFISIEDLRLLLGKDFTEATAHEIMSQIDSGEDEKSKSTGPLRSLVGHGI
jgi:calcium-dependent protein kinase